jgi:hypothetical protein
MMNVVEGNGISKQSIKSGNNNDIGACDRYYKDIPERVINDEEKKRAKEKGFNVMKG